MGAGSGVGAEADCVGAGNGERARSGVGAGLTGRGDGWGGEGGGAGTEGRAAEGPRHFWRVTGFDQAATSWTSGQHLRHQLHGGRDTRQALGSSAGDPSACSMVQVGKKYPKVYYSHHAK